jgi:hypothetical protein
LWRSPQGHLRHDLVREAVRHHERRVAGGAAQVHQPPAGQHGDALAVGEDELIDLRLDVLLGDLRLFSQPRDLSISLSK